MDKRAVHPLSGQQESVARTWRRIQAQPRTKLRRSPRLPPKKVESTAPSGSDTQATRASCDERSALKKLCYGAGLHRQKRRGHGAQSRSKRSARCSAARHDLCPPGAAKSLAGSKRALAAAAANPQSAGSLIGSPEMRWTPGARCHQPRWLERRRTREGPPFARGSSTPIG